MTQPYGIVLHGGAGDLARYATTSRLDDARVLLQEIVDTSYSMLEKGASALDVITDAVMAMEDSGYFHAGRGSSPTTNGSVEMDASVMNGRQAAAGAVASVRNLKNPILAARAVMEQTPHVLLVGAEAEFFATTLKHETVEPPWFVPCDVSATAWEVPPTTTMGTVGAVALDKTGNLCAATSTGGTLNKRAGRVGDSPIIGAGTYAMDNVAAVSCTGVGEYFIREVAAYQLCARMQFVGESVHTAAGVVMSRIHEAGGSGGLIAIDSRGTITMPYSTSGMYRAGRNSMGFRQVACLQD